MLSLPGDAEEDMSHRDELELRLDKAQILTECILPCSIGIHCENRKRHIRRHGYLRGLDVRSFESEQYGRQLGCRGAQARGAQANAGPGAVFTCTTATNTRFFGGTCANGFTKIAATTSNQADTCKGWLLGSY